MVVFSLLEYTVSLLECTILNYSAPDVVENLLYLLWCHLRYYLVYCIPSDPEPHLLLPTIGHTPIRRLQGLDNFSMLVV